MPADVGTEAKEAVQLTAARLASVKWALLAGATLLVAVAVAVPWIVEAPAEGTSAPDRQLVDMLSLVDALLLASSIFVALVVPGRMAASGPQAFATRHIVRWAVLEGAALFGAVVVLLAGLEHIVPAEPLYYANLLGYVVFALVLLGDRVRD